jgi:hypothetical protein
LFLGIHTSVLTQWVRASFFHRYFSLAAQGGLRKAKKPKKKDGDADDEELEEELGAGDVSDEDELNDMLMAEMGLGKEGPGDEDDIECASRSFRIFT